MKKKIKKAFTLVELLVVIAILAILATVSIVGYNSFTKKARVSNDTALVSQLNTILKADSMVNGNTKTPTDALKLTEEAGYDVEKLTPTATGYQIIWNQETSQFALLDEKDNVVYGDKNTDEYKNWKFVSEYSSATNYSVYLKGTSFTSVPEIHAGIDTGKNTKITAINYKNSGAKENVVIRTNSASTSLTINDATTGSVHHYGSAGALNIIQCYTESYHENGKVAFAEISKGRIVLEKGADVEEIHVNKKENEQAFDTVIIANNGGTEELPKRITRDAVTVSEETLVVKVEANGTSENVYVYASGSSGTTEKTNTQNTSVDSPLGQLVLDNGSNPGEKAQTPEQKEAAKTEVINDAKSEEVKDTVVWLNKEYNGKDKMSFAEFIEAVNSSEDGFLGYTATLQANVTLESEVNMIKLFCGTFDGQTYKIKNLIVNQPNVEYVGLFKEIKDGAIIKNVNIVNARITAGKKVGALIGKITGEATVMNCSTDSSSSISGGSNVAGLIGYIQYDDSQIMVELNGLTNNATINSSGDRAAGIVGTITGSSVVTLINCQNNGAISAQKSTYGGASGIVATIQGHSNITFNNCQSSIVSLNAGTTAELSTLVSDNSKVHVVGNNSLETLFYKVTTNYSYFELNSVKYFVKEATKTWSELTSNIGHISFNAVDTIAKVCHWAAVDKGYILNQGYTNYNWVSVLVNNGTISGAWNKINNSMPGWVDGLKEYCRDHNIAYTEGMTNYSCSKNVLYRVSD